MFTQTGTTANLLFPFFLFSLHTHSRRLLRLKYTPDPLLRYLYPHFSILIEARMAEWSKAVVSGTILFGGVGSNPTPCIFFSDSSIRLPSNSSTCVPLKTDCCLLYTFAPSLSRDSVAEWSKACDSKSLLLWRRRFESCRCRFFFFSFSLNSNALSPHSTRQTVWPSGLRRLT